MRVAFTLNGEARAIEAEPMARLLDVLRRDLALTGSKEGCGEGECGACTVLLDGAPVCSCLVPVAQIDGRAVTTVEGIAAGPRKDAVERFQRVFVAEGAAQCGACTPGMIVTLAALLERHASPTREQIRDFASGTLCRCTGYERIFRAVEVMTGQRPPEGIVE
jgi:aerobic-type carbon monoxide dehydrogenase small subunit (CoxS/CutS family)